MKSQTKALLASVMVLALALSSIGGVTYSWFADSQTINVGMGTATIDVSTDVEFNPPSGEGGISLKESDDPYQKKLSLGNSGEYDITLNFTNNSTIPVDITAKFVVWRYQAITLNENGTPKGHVGEVTNIAGDQDNSLTYTYFYGSFDRLLFGPHDIKLIEHRYFTTPKGEYQYITDIIRNYDAVTCWEDYYNIGSISIEKSGTGQLSFHMKIMNGFDPNAMPNVTIEISCTQSNAIAETIVDNEARVTVSGDKPIFFTGGGFNIFVSKEALQGIDEIKLEVFTNPDIMVKLSFLQNLSESAPGNGIVIISFSSETTSGSITTPATNGELILFSNGDTGNTSS